MPSILTTLVQERVTAAAATTISRTVEKIAEALAEDLLRDPDFRSELREITKVAFINTLNELRKQADK